MNRKIILTFLMIIAFCSQVSADALNPFFQQNGDCYVLIGDGPYRGVYALNNLTGGTVQLLYRRDDLDSYGLAAGQRMNGTVIQKNLYTFAGQDTGWTAYTGSLERRVITSAATGLANNVAHPFIVNSCHGPVNMSPTGRGNHQSGAPMWPDYPCAEIPAATTGQPGFYTVQTGRFYHALDWPVYTPCPQQWVHWVIRENVEVKYRNLQLYNYDRTASSGPAITQNLPSVKTSARATMDKIGECYDGCIAAQGGIDLPGQPVPILDCAYSSYLSRSYLYSREPNSTAYSLTGQIGTDELKGLPGDLTSKSLGVSSKDSTGNYVYVLGVNAINGWLAAGGAPSDWNLQELTDVAISDQWWQTGGIVYCYDKLRGIITKMVRQESRNISEGFQEITDINTGGSPPDAIGVDGFGHLFMLKTNFDPVATQSFVPNDAYAWVPSTDPMPSPPNRCRAKFRQRVTKTVYRRDYYTGITTKLPGEIWIGDNQFIRDFGSSTPTDRTTWVWVEPSFTQLAPVVQSNYRCELAVINTPTPPVSGNATGVTDCYGPLVLVSDNLVNATPDTGGFFERDTDYYFAVENPPQFEGKVNVGNRGEDKDADGRVGSFPNSIKESTIKYTWKILKTKEWDGTVISPPQVIVDQEFSNPYFCVNLPEGEYKIGTKVAYKFYDTSKITPGQLSDQLENTLSSETVAIGEDSENLAWRQLKIKWTPARSPLNGAGVIMSGKYSGSSYLYKPTRAQDPNVENPPPITFVLKEKVAMWGFSLRDSNYHLTAGIDRVASLYDTPPPDPNAGRAPTDPPINFDPTTLKWDDDYPVFTWSTELYKGNDLLYSSPQIKLATNSIFASDFARLFPVSSQPATYTLKVVGTRGYSYKRYVITQTYPRVVRALVGPIPKSFKVEATAYIVVTDETPPQMTFTDPVTGTPVNGYYCHNDLFYGTTGETLANVQGPPSPFNPDYFEYIVVDNNPFANLDSPNFTDVYHGDVTHHDVADRVASFSYGTSRYGMMPDVLPSVQDEYRSNSGATSRMEVQDLDETSFGNIPWVTSTDYNKLFSYRLYKIHRDRLAHFSKDRNNNWVANIDTNLANSSLGYTNPVFGIGWKEASGMGTAPNRLGYLVIRDNDRPNAFIKVVEQKQPAFTYYSPTNINLSNISSTSWFILGTSDPTNGLLNWNSANIGGFDSAVKILPANNITNGLASTSSVMEIPQIEMDVPVQFTPILVDNVSPVTVESFVIRDSSNNAVPGIDDRTDSQPIRGLFRLAGDYKAVLTVKDAAKAWPTSDPRRNPTNATCDNTTVNKRVLECAFRVFATRLEVRILDRNTQGR